MNRILTNFRIDDESMKVVDELVDLLAKDKSLTLVAGKITRSLVIRLAVDRGIKVLKEEFE